MSLSDLASLGSFISGLAVLITLAFLVLQMRQTERNQRALMQQGRADRVSENSLRPAENAELSSLFSRGRRGDKTMPEEDVVRFLLICRAGFLSGEDSFLQYRAGALDTPAFDSFVAGARHFFCEPGMRAAWRMSAHQFGDEFRAFMDKLHGETPIAAPTSVLDRWKAELAGEGP